MWCVCCERVNAGLCVLSGLIMCLAYEIYSVLFSYVSLAVCRLGVFGCVNDVYFEFVLF